ncbi:hypothetical protein M419DRAFT_12727 [Trichoderma reesei RUT C-30]|uniref:Uncharacterized protein n=1 Tax=Hypocrea jecorina (strain ATCC 56765 / BCRC 32924 / NRRL 11460 / Rut C-30) TaxID=1344414 RepID=A0A024RZU4_HYPJR|nr:hypothetical protein M419DRAFT_12727 [Trichoderma reesei RUT C-30]
MPLPLPPGPLFGPLDSCRRITVLIEPIVRKMPFPKQKASSSFHCGFSGRSSTASMAQASLPHASRSLFFTVT